MGLLSCYASDARTYCQVNVGALGVMALRRLILVLVP